MTSTRSMRGESRVDNSLSIPHSSNAPGFQHCAMLSALATIMQRPIMEALHRNGMPEKLVYLNPTEPFNLYLKIGALAGLFVASPVVLFQVWLFISPGLYRKEKRYVFPFMFSTVALFLAGGYFGFKLVYPQALDFLIGYGRQFQPMITIGEYTDLFLVIILGMVARDLIFTSPVRSLADRHSKRAPTWRYYFDYTAVNARSRFPNGVSHGAEIVYFLDTGDFSPDIRSYFSQPDRDYARRTSDYLFEFARSGRPASPGSPAWPNHDARNDKTLQFGQTISVQPNFMKTRLNVFIGGSRLLAPVLNSK